MARRSITSHTNPQLFQDIIESIDEAFILFDKSWRYIYINKKAEIYLKKKREEIIGKKMTEVFPKATSSRIYQKGKTVLKTGKPIVFEERANTFDGWWHVRIYPSALGISFYMKDITQEKKDQDLLIENQRRINLAYEAGNIGTFEWDLETNKIYRSPIEDKLLGIKPDEEMKIEVWTRRVHPEDVRSLMNELKRALKGKKETYDSEYRVLIPPNTIRWILNKAHIYYSPKGKPLKIVGVNLDITERKANEETRATLASLVESSDDAVIGKNLDAIITSWNLGAEKIYGYKAEEVVGKPITVLTPPFKKEEISYIMGRIKKGKAIDHFETVRMRKDGILLDVSVTISPIRDSKGKIIGASTIARDITGRKRDQDNLEFLSQASKILASSLQYEQTLLSVAKLAVPQIADWCTIDLVKNDGSIDQVAITHKDPKKIKWAQKLRREFPPNLENDSGLPRVIRTGKSELYSAITEEMLRATIKNKKQLELLLNVGFTSVILVPLFSQGRTIGVISFITSESRKRYEISDLAMVEELASRASLAIENARLYKESQEAIHLRDEFISVVSHELKTPVTSLKVYNQVLSKQVEKGKGDYSSYFIKMDNQINKLSNLIQDLLSISRLQTGKLLYKEELVNVQEVIEEVVESIQPLAKNHTILTSGSTKAAVIGDKDRIGQVFTNLLNNAIRYSPNANKILINSLQSNDIISVSVQDFGIGIKNREKEKIFERFYQVEGQDDRTYPGLGIGLYVSKEIVEKHGGTISLTSEEGKGSTFTVILPIHKSTP